MAAAPPSQKNDHLLPAAQELKKMTRISYERNVLCEIRVLDAKISKLEVQLNKELEKISCSGLMEEIIAQPQGSPCSSLWAQLDRARAKIERAYHKFQRQQQLEMEIDGDEGQGGGGAPNAPDGVGAGSKQQQRSGRG